MFNIVISFLLGCTFTYLITVMSSAIKASKILEDAAFTYALLMMSAYEISVGQLEKSIYAAKLDTERANVLRKTNKSEFEKFANPKIKKIVSMIPLTHTNIIRYNNFSEMNEYISEQLGSRNARSNKKI
jgi:hypothetical protein